MHTQPNVGLDINEYIKNKRQPIVFNNLKSITSLTIKDINTINEAQ